jgi:DNA-binding transcriptional MerR regulator/methylmalonyl-CoA mutase cobalamin-binding subunit
MAERLYRIRVAAERVGISENLLRAWERRYGIVKPRRTEGGYRAYTDEDVEILIRVKQLTEEGMSIAEAARMATDVRKAVRAPALLPGRAADESSGVEAWNHQLIEAAIAGDQKTAESILDEALAALPPLRVFEQVMSPVLIEVGERWHKGELSVASEHLLSHSIRVRLFSLIHGAPMNSRRHAVCACLPDEDHEIGLLGVTLRMRYAGMRVTYLGARTPAEQLGQLIKDVRPDLLALSTVDDHGGPALRTHLKAIKKALPFKLPVYIGGANALRHPEVCEKLGLRVVADEKAWGSLLG